LVSHGNVLECVSKATGVPLQTVKRISVGMKAAFFKFQNFFHNSEQKMQE
jgi:hypothetical protein